MNERIKLLVKQAADYANTYSDAGADVWFEIYNKRFAELIVEECRNVVSDVYRKTPLEICGPLLTADEEIAKHFYGVEE